MQRVRAAALGWLLVASLPGFPPRVVDALGWSAAGPQDAAAVPPKTAAAARVAGEAIDVDGRLDDEAWLAAPPVTDFIQKEPTEGAEPTDAMEVRFAYNERSLYIGARMHSRDGVIQAPLGRRDDPAQAEYILIAFDTFLDHRTAVAFGVTAAGVRIDRHFPTDNEDNFDAGFDLVWTAKTEVFQTGWTAEIEIPFTQLRFRPERDLVWGLNIQRFRPTLDEEDVWVLIPRTVRAWSSQFGILQGVAGVGGTRRVEVLPYLAGGSVVNGARDPANPFDDGKNLSGRAGADLKIGLGPNLTLDATINPDFGQVEADPAEVNLTAFETRFPEKRPFFLEGASLFNIGHPNFYYSRRIGAKPSAPASADFVDYPQTTTILAAAKITGRLQSGTSIGLLGAATDNETATLATRGSVGTAAVAVAPRAYHAVGRVLQEFGSSGSTAGVFVNYLHRDFSGSEPLAQLFSRNALGVAGTTLVRFKGGEYELRAAGGGSYLNGEPAAVERIQRTSAHYAQRPDRTYGRLDPSKTSLAGWTLQANVDRVSGRHWLFGANTKIDSVDFEPNDFAQLNGADGVMTNANLRYRETTPGRIFRSYSLGINVQTDATLRDRLLQSGRLRSTVNVTWANFWTTNVSLSRDFATQSVTLTRGGPVMGRGPGWTFSANAGTRSASETRGSVSLNISTNEDGEHAVRASGSISARPGPRWRLSVTPEVERLTEPQQYVTTLGGGRPETYDTRYIFAFIDRSTVSMQFRLGLTLKPDLNLDVYAEPFAASGRYDRYGELLAPRSRQRLTYGTEGTALTLQPDGSRVVTAGGSTFTLANKDFNTLSFRSNVVLRWEWRIGSTLYVVWQQDRSGTERIGDYVGLRDAFRSVAAPGRNLFLVKTSFWMPF